MRSFLSKADIAVQGCFRNCSSLGMATSARACGSKAFGTSRNSVHGGSDMQGVRVSRQRLCRLLSTTPLWFASEAAKAQQLPKQAAEAQPPKLIEDLLARSQLNKAKHDKNRLDSYNRRNFKDYFGVELGDPELAKKRGLSPETIKSIQDWLAKNK